MIPFLKPNIKDSDIQRAVKSIKSGWLVPGKYTSKFETDLSAYLDKDCVMLSSCTAALHLALIMAGVKEGDEVITTPLSWVSTSNVILYLGAKPVFADVDAETGILDINAVRRAITPKTKAVIVVHLYGQMADMREFNRLPVPVIEDSAHALESKRDGLRPGSGFAACFSFHAAKNITCGNGGAIAIRDTDTIKRLRRHGVQNIDGKRVMIEMGHKYEPTDFQAALLIGQLKRIESSHSKRQRVFKRYEDAFAGKIRFPKTTRKQACHMFFIWVKNRDLIRKRLLKKGIETSIHYSPIHLEPYYQQLGFKKGSFPIVERMGEEVITLPTYNLTKKEQDYIIKEVLNENRVNSTR
jgi:UDP-4-amino-4-deoxy-L-arabinose-oxoglutarate aminotransferase